MAIRPRPIYICFSNIYNICYSNIYNICYSNIDNICYKNIDIRNIAILLKATSNLEKRRHFSVLLQLSGLVELADEKPAFFVNKVFKSVN